MILLFECIIGQVQDENNESLIIVTELRENGSKMTEEQYHSLCKELVGKINQDHGISPSEIVIIQPKTIIKTTSGKIKRNAIKESYLKNSLSVLYRYITQSSTEQEHDESIKYHISNFNDFSPNHPVLVSAPQPTTTTNTAGVEMKTIEQNSTGTTSDDDFCRYYTTPEGEKLEKVFFDPLVVISVD